MDPVGFAFLKVRFDAQLSTCPVASAGALALARAVLMRGALLGWMREAGELGSTAARSRLFGMSASVRDELGAVQTRIGAVPQTQRLRAMGAAMPAR